MNFHKIKLIEPFILYPFLDLFDLIHLSRTSKFNKKLIKKFANINLTHIYFPEIGYLLEDTFDNIELKVVYDDTFSNIKLNNLKKLSSLTLHNKYNYKLNNVKQLKLDDSTVTQNLLNINPCHLVFNFSDSNKKNKKNILGLQN
jgi:hypothetical protein